jgi:hypothetical protein
LLKEIRAIKRKSPRTIKGLAKKYPKKSFEEIFGWGKYSTSGRA